MSSESSSPIPADVIEFLTYRVSTASELDVLLLLLSLDGNSLTPADAGGRLRFGEYFARLLLERLWKAGLARRANEGYVLAADNETRETLTRISQLMDRYRLRLTRYVVRPGF